MKRFIAFFLSLLLLAAFCACDVQKGEDDGKISAVCTLFVYYDAARAVGDGLANISLLLPPGAESHDYDPTPGDIAGVCSADIVFYGGRTEQFSKGILAEAKDDCCVDLSQNIELLRFDDDDTVYDEHFWTSVKNMITIVKNTEAAFAKKDPKNAAIYHENAEKYIAELEKTDALFEALAKEYQDKTLIFASEFPFLYFCREYGFDFAAAYDTCSEHSEASPARVAELIKTVKEENIKTVYYKELCSVDLASTICLETGAKMSCLHSCHNLSKEDFDSGKTYLSIMNENAQILCAEVKQ